MPENDFEKQVQQLFDGFKLSPSDEVWQHVNERIKGDKKDRKIFFWLPALLLLLVGGAGAYLKWGSSDNTKAVTTQSVHSSNSNAMPHAGEESISKSIKENTAGNSGNSSVESKHDEQDNTGSTGIAGNNKNIIKDGSRSGFVPGQVSLAAKESRANTQAAVDRNEKEQSGIHQPLPVLKNAGAVVKNTGKFREAADRSVLSAKTVNDKRISDEEKKDRAIQYREFSGELTQQHVSAEPFKTGMPKSEKSLLLFDKSVFTANQSSTPVKLSKKKAWEFGVTASAGISKTGGGLSDVFSNFGTERKNADAAPPMMVNNNFAGIVASQNNNYLAALPPAPTPVKPGFAWSAGASAKWYIKSRLALSGALLYTYNTTNREVGSMLNNNGGNPQYNNAFGFAIPTSRYAGAYGSGDRTQYTNKYHVLEAPLGIQWQLNKGIKFAPVQLNTGISVGWLMGTDALHYEKISGSYYENKSLFNKVYAGLYAGVSAKLFQHSRTPLYIGPYVQYGLSNLLKSSAETQQNLMFGGIKAEWILWRK